MSHVTDRCIETVTKGSMKEEGGHTSALVDRQIGVEDVVPEHTLGAEGLGSADDVAKGIFLIAGPDFSGEGVCRGYV